MRQVDGKTQVAASGLDWAILRTGLTVLIPCRVTVAANCMAGGSFGVFDDANCEAKGRVTGSRRLC